MKPREISTLEIAAVYGHKLIRHDGFPPPLRRSRPYTFNADDVKRWFFYYRARCAASRAAGLEKKRRRT